MDGFYFFLLAPILLHLTVERAEIMSLSPLLLLVVGRVEGGVRLWSELTSLWHVFRESVFPADSGNGNYVFAYHLFSIIAISIFC